MNLPCIIDVEASGLGRGSYPIEVGFIDKDGVTGCTLIKPEPDWQHWNVEAEHLHGISRDLLQKHGRSIVDVCNWLNEHLSGQVVYSDGWANDMCWLGSMFDEACCFQAFKLKSILDLLTVEEREAWSPIHESVIETANFARHRASSDAKMIQDTYAQVKASFTP